jgi:hypothetical protein
MRHMLLRFMNRTSVLFLEQHWLLECDSMFHLALHSINKGVVPSWSEVYPLGECCVFLETAHFVEDMPTFKCLTPAPR